MLLIKQSKPLPAPETVGVPHWHSSLPVPRLLRRRALVAAQWRPMLRAGDKTAIWAGWWRLRASRAIPEDQGNVRKASGPARHRFAPAADSAPATALGARARSTR